MNRQKEQADLTRDKIRELIKDLEPGTLLTLEMPVKTAETEEESDID